MRPMTVIVGPLATAADNKIATAQTVTTGNSFTLDGASVSGGVAVLDKSRRVQIKSAGDDSGITFAISGTNVSGDKISETVAGANTGSATSVLDYATVTSVKPSAGTASTVQIGTTGVAGSAWVRFDEYAFGPVGAQFAVSGTVDFTLQTTYDDPNDFASPVAPSAVTWVDQPGVSNQTSSQQWDAPSAPRWARVLLNSGTGSVTATFIQHASGARAG